MDPNANLKEQLELAAEIIKSSDANEGYFFDPAKAVRLAELVEALDGWLSKGGFLPGKWERK